MEDSRALDEIRISEPARELSLTAARYLLVLAAIWEFVFNRLASTLGLYTSSSPGDAFSTMAVSGQFAMYALTIIAIFLNAFALTRLAASGSYGPLPIRLLLLALSPFYLPLVTIALFRIVSPTLILFAYLAATLSAVCISALVIFLKVSSSRKRLIIALGFLQVFATFECVAAYTQLSLKLPVKAYMLAEIIFIFTPIIAISTLWSGQILRRISRPHLLGLVFSSAVTAVAALLVTVVPGKELLAGIAFRTLGLTLATPLAVPIYVGALFIGSYALGTALLPSRRWPPTPATRTTGVGLLCIWLAGVQPSRPYLFMMMILGMCYLATGLSAEDENAKQV